jgi:outer membrane receptor protein involved in Fe transport
VSGKETINMYGGRLDYQFSPDTRLMFKADGAQRFTPFGTLGSNHLAGAASTDEKSWRVLGSLVNVLSNRTLNEVKVGYSYIWWNQQPLSRWSKHPQAAAGIGVGNPIIRLRGFAIAGSLLQPRIWEQPVTTIRDDFTLSYDARGRHDLKVGGEFLWSKSRSTNCNNCMGILTARGGPLPSAAAMQAMFPDPFNVDTWNLAPLNPLVQRYEIAVGDFNRPDVLPKYGAWIQDDWQISSRLTLNLGLRYDRSGTRLRSPVPRPGDQCRSTAGGPRQSHHSAFRPPTGRPSDVLHQREPAADQHAVADVPLVNNTNGRYPQGFRTPGIVRQWQQANGGAINGQGSWADTLNTPYQYSTWFQDDWRATARLTLNLGVRYDLDLEMMDQKNFRMNATRQAMEAIGSPYGGYPRVHPEHRLPAAGAVGGALLVLATCGAEPVVAQVE